MVGAGGGQELITGKEIWERVVINVLKLVGVMAA